MTTSKRFFLSLDVFDLPTGVILRIVGNGYTIIENKGLSCNTRNTGQYETSSWKNLYTHIK